MSFLTERPDLMMEVICVLVRKLGGSVTITGDDAPGPFNLLTRIDGGNALHIALDETCTAEEVRKILAGQGGSA